MPQLDKTGPMGQGSQTGRKQGSCSSNDKETVEFTPRGRGMGRGLRNKMKNDIEAAIVFGRGRGRNAEKGHACGMRLRNNSQVQ